MIYKDSVFMEDDDREAYKKRFPMHNLTIIGNTVRLYIEHTQMYFRFDEYGGERGAIKAAQAKRDLFPASNIHSLYDTDKVRPMGVTGIRGIIRYINYQNGEWLGYVAKWQEGAIGNGRRDQKKQMLQIRRIHRPSASCYQPQRKADRKKLAKRIAPSWPVAVSVIVSYGNRYKTYLHTREPRV